jgi:putative flippase GtrA
MINLYHKYEEIINYLIIGILTTLVSLLTYYMLTFTILNANKALELQIANVLAWIVSVTFAYFTNRKIVFKQKDKSNIREAAKFYTSRVTTLLIDMALMFVFVTKLKFNDKIVKVIVQVIVIVLNYMLSKFLVFKKNK